MDAAEMIKEEGLKKGFMLATLISTIAGTFITGINLYDRVVDQRRQHKMDRTQNKKIKELEARLGQAEEEKKRIKEAREQDKKRHSKKGRHRGSDDDSSSTSSSDDDDKHRRRRDRDLRRSLEYGGTSIQREFDRYIRNMGHQFAQGDLVAQTQLQSQIIILQSSVIKLLEEALITGNPPDISRLYNTSEFARQGSIRALQDQYQRMIQSAAGPPAPYPGPGGPVSSRPRAPIRRTSSTPSLRGSDRGSVYGRQQHQQQPHQQQRKALPAPSAAGGSVVSASRVGGSPLFCRYAEDLQRTAGAPFDLSDRQHCPACRAVLGFSNQSSWRIEKKVRLRADDRMSNRSSSRIRGDGRGGDDDEDGDSQVVTRSFILTPRFVAKCHREGPNGYACYLCNRNRDRDTICRSEEALVNHVASKHGVSEYVHERDIKEMAKTLPYR
ncbi:hypothetical protein QBC42DRAFT_296314 [Cladorrhinum samala]|uniref:Uncharacterized protein n=1 Tax=Cladorrhinum samala TaxID=585594 RepID=A0AAV9HTA4_9PEZI|nr:hypothetical protein QBC42DRAFT_296314 [Cladorrhinum samala]